MDLWIRSQDRKVLAKVNDIAINDTEIIGYFDKETEFENLGNYKTEERALEVLDEIQNILKIGLKINNNNQFVGTTTYVYKMPKE